MGNRKRHVVLSAGTLAFAALVLSGCASQRSPYNRYYMANGAYRAPGTPTDPWGPYIRQAAQRFSIPEDWIRAVIHQESGGHEYMDGQPITSSAGAMGLMQLMPQTYADMQERYGLGSDPYEPHDNIMAGTGYISILARKYGAPAFLAAYNAGPVRLEDYLYEGRPLPSETVNYVASITPHLGTQVAMTGPLASYASASQLNASPMEVAEAPETQQAPYSSQMIAMQSAPVQSSGQTSVSAVWARRHFTPVPSSSGPLEAPAPVAPCNADDAYDPSVPCADTPMPQQELPPPAATAAPAAEPSSSGMEMTASNLPPPPVIPTPARSPARQTTSPHTVVVGYHMPGSYGPWGVQVGAFANIGQARFAATMARQTAFSSLESARIEVQPTLAHGTRFWRARLTGISRTGAAHACSTLAGEGMACMAVPPGH
ncbi:lytic transglycosylase domain-containing protein [Gluconobacter morbifer]|uniref:Murein transglycosylase n=1 Tax=Gluconobacter morbifer G707 TaxID=1088869 RepID=G6XJ99_9PROT|nr:lytic transglycosylase domain-containing protein [Gluconobacter morbifer]EHH68215.1 hypothetical protein GMO_15650 [Gluconobacter morbifer G707]